MSSVKQIQKYKRTDRVEVISSPFFSQTNIGDEAIVMGSYADRYGGSNTDDYTLMFMNGSSSSWWPDRCLEPVREGTEAEIEAVIKARDEREAVESEPSLIIERWKEGPPVYGLTGASERALFRMLGVDKPWGKRGEGITYYSNVVAMVSLLDPVMREGDVAKLEAFCAEWKSSHQGVKK